MAGCCSSVAEADAFAVWYSDELLASWLELPLTELFSQTVLNEQPASPEA